MFATTRKPRPSVRPAESSYLEYLGIGGKRKVASDDDDVDMDMEDASGSDFKEEKENKRAKKTTTTKAKPRAKKAAPVVEVVPEPPTMSQEQMEEMSKGDVIEYALNLQKYLASIPKPKELSEDEIAEKAAKIRQMMNKGIEKQMKWTPSCKTGKAKFVYEGQVPSAAMFKRVFRLPADHSKKMFKISTDEFGGIAGGISASVRYATLDITGTDVNVKWQEEELTFKVSGTYGKY